MPKIDHKKVNYSKITSNIYIGTNFCCTKHFNRGLMKKGLRVDISLEDVRIDSPFGVKWYLWLPTKDHTAPKQDQLEAGVNCIQSVMDTKNKVYVHCMNGHGRAPTLVAAYFVSIGMSVKDAVEFIKCKRPEIHINKSQINCLKQFKKRHANK